MKRPTPEQLPPLNITAAELNSLMDFDHCIRVHPDGSVTDMDPRFYAPDLYDDELQDQRWTLLNGYSSQDRYSGPMMHQSEFIGGSMARDILATPGVYVALINYPSDDSEPTEWAVARMEDE